jgi:2-haloacid dehalogenase
VSETIDTRGVRALTFDCYGTLIDWDGGIATAMAELSSLAGCDVPRLLFEREELEKEIEAGDWLPYGEVLEQSLAAAASSQGRSPSTDELRRFAESMARWPAHPDAPAALARLARRFRLAILSNVETATLRASVRLLGAPFAALVTAEEVRSYKPARAHFDEGLRRLGLGTEGVIHVACSLFHDVAPANALGLRAIWVDRRGDGDARGLEPELVVRDIAELADRLGC